MEKHFVTFCSPGTFFAEQSTKEIPSWDIGTAIKLSKDIKERYDALPYGFYFTTRTRGPDDFDSEESARSPFHWLGGEVQTLEEVEARNDPSEETLRSNMRSNKWNKIVVNTNSYKWTQPLEDDHVIVDVTPDGYTLRQA
jgi:hypothetical protein